MVGRLDGRIDIQGVDPYQAGMRLDQTQWQPPPKGRDGAGNDRSSKIDPNSVWMRIAPPSGKFFNRLADIVLRKSIDRQINPCMEIRSPGE